MLRVLIFVFAMIQTAGVAVAEQKLPGASNAQTFDQGNPCKGLDLKDVDAVYSCFTFYDDAFAKAKIYMRQRSQADYNRSLQRFNAFDDCMKYQTYIFRMRALSDGSSLKVIRSTLKDASNSYQFSYMDGIPNCSVIADLVEYHTGNRPAWDGCFLYDEATDKKEHLTQCVLSYQTARLARGNREKAVETLRKAGCDEILATYERALRNVYAEYDFTHLNAGYLSLPKTYSQLDCIDIATIKF